MLGLWVVFQSLTGLVLLFPDPIEHWAHPGLTRHGHGDLGAAAALDTVRRNEAWIDLPETTEVRPVDEGAVEIGAVDVGAVEIDLTDTATEIDLTEAVEIDLTDRGLNESTITLESGDTLESGIVGPPPPD